MRARNKLVRGIGVNDYPGNSNEVIHARGTWTSVLTRSEGFLKYEESSYNDCYLSPDWVYFTGFLDWYNTNYIKDWQIDKDILLEGNREYGPEVCCYVPGYLNGLIVNWNLESGAHLMSNAITHNLTRPYYSKISEREVKAEALVCLLLLVTQTRHGE